MIKKAIVDYINAKTNLIKVKTEKAKPCQHNWELLDKALFSSKLNPDYKWFKWTYFCKKCGEHKIFENTDIK